MAHIAVLGAGSWGTALAVLLCRNGHSVTLWSHRKEHADSMRKTGINEKSFPGIRLPETLTYTSDIEEAVSGRDLVLFVVPSTALRETAGKAATCLKREQLICCASKGIEEGTLLTQCGILEEILPDNAISVLSGPSHAEEVIDGLPTVVVAGSADRSAAERIQEIFMNRTFRVYTSPDVQGIEIGAALKNVIALAAGMSDGLGYGDNAKAALITRGIKEISALAGDAERSGGYRRSDRDLQQPAQPKPQGRDADRPGHERQGGHGGGKYGGGGRLFHPLCPGIGREISGLPSHY